MNNESSGHLKALQSLRGLAAVTVLIHHCLRLIADADNAWFVSERILNAHAAVVVFFVLSGYVLTLSLLRGKFSANSILSFCVKRICRIYPALWIGVTFGIFYTLTLSNPPQAFFSEWANSLNQPSAANLPAIAGSLLAIRTELLPPLWTIKVELIASIVLLPSAVYLLNRYRGWPFSIACLLSLMAVSFLFPGSATPLYLYQFVIGAICAVYSREIPHNFSINTPVISCALVVLVFFRQLFDWPYHHPLPSLVESLAGAVLILGLVQGRAKWMSQPPLVYLGDISYGIYLFHLPIALFVSYLTVPQLLHVATPDATATIIATLVAAITLAVASLVYHRVELPFIALGRKASSAIANMFRGRADNVV